MDYSVILENLVGTSPFVGFLLWYILSERKVRQEDKEYTRKKIDEREKGMIELLLKNHEVLDNSQDIMRAMSEKYDDLKKIVEKGFTEINKDIKDVYKKLGECE